MKCQECGAECEDLAFGKCPAGCPPAEMVNHPAHYNAHPSGVECIDVIEHFPHNVGAAIKYFWRAGLKNKSPIEDLRKGAWYIEREIQRLTKAGKT